MGTIRQLQIRIMTPSGRLARYRHTYAFNKKREDATIAPNDAAAEKAVSDGLLINDTCMSVTGLLPNAKHG